MWYMCQPDQCRGLYLHSLLAAAIARTRFFCVAAFPPRTSRPSVFSPLPSPLFHFLLFSSPPSLIRSFSTPLPIQENCFVVCLPIPS